MISLVIDKIENAPLYYGLGERFRKALEWLAAVDPSTLSPGEKVPIDGENVYGLLFQVDTLAPGRLQTGGASELRRHPVSGQRPGGGRLCLDGYSAGTAGRI